MPRSEKPMTPAGFISRISLQSVRLSSERQVWVCECAHDSDFVKQNHLDMARSIEFNNFGRSNERTERVRKNQEWKSTELNWKYELNLCSHEKSSGKFILTAVILSEFIKTHSRNTNTHTHKHGMWEIYFMIWSYELAFVWCRSLLFRFDGSFLFCLRLPTPPTNKRNVKKKPGHFEKWRVRRATVCTAHTQQQHKQL